MASVSPPSRARSADRLSSSRFISRASGQSFANEASIGTIECFRAWTRVMRMRISVAAARAVSTHYAAILRTTLGRLDAGQVSADLVAERFRFGRETVGRLQHVGRGLAGLVGRVRDADDVVGDVLRARSRLLDVARDLRRRRAL